MFGDVFGSRSDYSRGMMYAARRSYLVGAPKASVKKHRINSLPKPCKEEVLKPPVIFQTRKQARRQAHGGRENHERTPQNVRQLEFKSSKAEEKRGRGKTRSEEGGKGLESSKRKDSQSKKYDAMMRAEAMGADSASDADSVEHEDLGDQQLEAWEQVKQAGVVFWHNTVTGEAQVNNPFIEEATDEGSIGEEDGLGVTRGEPDEKDEVDEGRDLFAFLERDNWEEEE